MTATAAPIHVRTIRVEAARAGEAEMEVTGRLVDERPQGGRWFGAEHGTTIHEMSLTVRVRYPDLVITAASGTMTHHPYTVCRDALPSLDRLVGLSVRSGFTRAVNERLGREKGCAHLAALVQAMAPVVRQGAGAAFGGEDAPPGADRDLWFVNSCQAWREHGDLHRRLAAGDVEGLKGLTAFRPPT